MQKFDIIPIETEKRYAYVVTLFGNDGYVPGALVVAHAFHRLGDLKHVDLICLVTPDVSKEARELLECYYTHVVVIDYLLFDKPIHPSVIKLKPHYAKVWTKFHALRLTSYQKICLIDADYLPYRSMLSVFDYNTPAAVTEVPTGITTNLICRTKSQQNKSHSCSSFPSYDEIYSPEWAKLFGNCCSGGKQFPGIIPLILLYSNNLDVEAGRYSDNPTLTGNFYYGGMNASVMVLEPNIFEFRDILHDLTSYDDETRLKFFYPEQQYLTLRYSFGKDLNTKKLTNINQEFLDFIDPYFNIFYSKIRLFQNLLSKENLSVCQKSGFCGYVDSEKLLETIDTLQIANNVLAYFVSTDNKQQSIGPWTSLGLEYFITEYYSELPSKDKWIGFPLLQQKKLWTYEGINLIIDGNASLGYTEWFEEFNLLIDDLTDFDFTPHSPDLSQYLSDKLSEWSDIMAYYQSVNFVE